MTLHYTHYTTTQLQLQLQLHYTKYTALQLQLHYPVNTATPALHHTALHPAVVTEVTTATIATTPKNKAPTTFRSCSGFALQSMHHNNSPLLSFPIFETSATALRGTTGINMEYGHSCFVNLLCGIRSRGPGKDF